MKKEEIIREEGYYSSIQEVNIEEVNDFEEVQEKKFISLRDHKFDILDL